MIANPEDRFSCDEAHFIQIFLFFIKYFVFPFSTMIAIHFFNYDCNTFQVKMSILIP